MAIDTRELVVTYGATKNYFSVSNLDTDASILGYDMPLRLWLNTSGTATFSASAKSALFPNAKAHPLNFKINTNFGALGSPVANFYIKADNNVIYSSTGLIGSSDQGDGSITYRNINETLTGNNIISLTQNSALQFQLTQASTGLLVAASLGADASSQQGATSGISLAMDFNRWTAAALPGKPDIPVSVDETGEASSNEILAYTSIQVSNANPWDYDSVTYSVALTSQGIFKGWYSDEACTQLVSLDEEYTTEITSDLTLYAYTSIIAHEINIIEDANVLSSQVSQKGETAEYEFSVKYPKNVEFLGWYGDEAKTQLLSTAKTFTKEISDDITVYTDSIALDYEVYQGEKRMKDIFIGDIQFS